MNGMTQGSTSLRSKKISQFHSKEISLHYAPPIHPADQASSVPLSFHCLGGNWDGQIQRLQTGLFLLRTHGLPPVEVGQELQFQHVGALQASFAQLTNGVIQKVSIQSNISLCERMTDIYITPCISQRIEALPFTSNQSAFPTECESIVFAHVAQEKTVEVSQIEWGVPKRSLCQSSFAINDDSQNATGNSEYEQIRSVRLSLENTYGETIQTYHDFPTDIDLATLPTVIIAPGYGETKRDYLALAYYFVSNGFHVIRYDHTNHVGESDGDHHDISLTSMKEDFQSVTQYVASQWPMQPIVGVAASLASRTAIKAEAEYPRLALLVSLMGIVDVQQSLATVHQEDLFAGYVEGKFPDSANVLGFNVSSDFLQDGLEKNFSTLASTVCDIESLSTPVIVVSAGNDAWVDYQAVQEVLCTLGESLVQHHIVPNSLHRLQENPKTARATYRWLIHQCHGYVNMSTQQHVIRDPNRLTLGRQKREEKNAQTQHSVPDLGRHFWQDYLGHFGWIAKCPDYVKLLDHLFHALGPLTSGQQMLDAGCGNGNAGLFYLQELQTVRQGEQRPRENHIRYVGVDLVPEALGKAKAYMTHMLHEIEKRRPECSKNLHVSWAQIDMQHTLPFTDNQFDRIVSNLVLGYVKNPQFALQELYRVLAPGGRMVLSNLKPNGDFSGIYHNLVENTEHREHREEARRLLHNYGKIRQAEKEDYFRFFDESEWQSILRSLGCLSAGVYPTFANQAYLVVLEKPSVGTTTSQQMMKRVQSAPQADYRCTSIEQAA